MNHRVAAVFSKLILSDRPLRIKLLGDSITHGAGGSGWEQNGEAFIEGYARSPHSCSWANMLRDFLEARYDCTVVNNGCSGTNIEYVIANFHTLVEAEDDILLCTIGTNNRHQYFSNGEKKTRHALAKDFYAHIHELNALCKASGKDYVLVVNIPASPENEQDGEDYWRILHMNDIHDLYVKAACTLNFPFIDLYTAFLSYCDVRGIDYTTLLDDGLHPNDAGYKVMFHLLLTEMGFAEDIPPAH